MAKHFNFNLTITIPTEKKIRISKKSKIISRKCLCVVIKDDDTNELLARIPKTIDKDEFIVLHFTDDSFDIKGKEYLFTKKVKDKDKRILYIPDSFSKYMMSGNSKDSHVPYSPIVEGILISGYIVQINGKNYFQYNNFVAFSEISPHFEDCKINEESPLFK